MRNVNKIGFTIIRWSLGIALIIEALFIYKANVFLNKEAKLTLERIVSEQAVPVDMVIRRAEEFAFNVSNIIEGTIELDEIRNNQEKIDVYEEKILGVLEKSVKKYELKNIWYQGDTRALGGISLIGLREIDGVIKREPKWDIIGSQYEEADWWKGPKEKGENWTDVYYYPPWNLFLTSFGKRIEKNGEFLGIVSVDLSLDEITKRLAKASIYKTGFFVLMDSKGKSIYRPNKIVREIPYFDSVVSEAIKDETFNNENNSGFANIHTENGKKVLSYKNLSNGWVLVAVIPLAEVTEKSNTLLFYIILCAIIICVLVGLFARNIISELKKQYKIVEDSYYYDNVTNLPNRVILIRDLLKHKGTDSNYLVVVHIENIIEIFNMVGHSKTDVVLKTISRYFSEFNHEEKIKIYNSHSLKFEFFLTDYDVNQLKNWIQTFSNYVKKMPIYIDGKCIYLKTTLGICLVERSKEGEEIINKAYKALEYACDNLKEYYIYNEKLEKVFFTTYLISQVSDAIKNNNFYLEYQPKVKLSNNRIEEVEALIRWKHSEYGIIPPDQFIPKLEKTETIKLLTNWVMEKAISDISEWREKNIILNVSINVTPRDLKDNEFLKRLDELLNRYNVEYESINIEITETDLIKDIDEVYDMLFSLREKGIKISIDDFGTGYSSLSYINTLPIDCIKIDRSFVKDLFKDEKKKKLIEDTLLLLHNLGKTVVAEGVENKEILDYLNEIGCEEIQGYYISRPLRKAQLEEFLEKHK